MALEKNNLPKKATMVRYLILSLVALVIFFLSRGVVEKEILFIEHSISCNSPDKIKALISQISSHKKQEAVAIFDVDETLIRRCGSQDGGSDWFTQSIYYLQKTKLLTFKEARNAVFPLYIKYLTVTPVELVEKGWLNVFGMLKRRDIPVIALTRRSVELAQFTVESLEQLGLTFAHHYFGEDFSIALTEEMGQHLKGVIFSGLNSKGEALEYFMKKQQSEKPFRPHLFVLYVDNSDLHIESVSQVLHKFATSTNTRITLYAVHYQNMHRKNFELTNRHKEELDEAYAHFSLSE